MSSKRNILLAVFLITLSTGFSNAQPSTTSPFFFARHSPESASTEYASISPEARAYFLDDRILFQSSALNFELCFVNSQPSSPQGEQALEARVNYLIGDRPQAWSTGLPTFAKLAYRSLYPGIDVRFAFTGNRLKSEFVVAPGADPSQIRFEYTGLGSPRIDAQGSLTFAAPTGFREEAPFAYQMKDGVRIAIPARFAISENGAVHFDLAPYDPSLPLIIDPVISYSSYLGGPGDNAATSVATDSNGNVYIAGWTDSVSFPTANALRSFNAGSVDAFVLKLNAAGNTLLYATYIGGSGDDRAYGIAVDGAGNAYVAGTTTSTNFPVLSAIQSTLRGARNAFVLKLNASGSALAFSTYLGGSGSDNANAIALDTQANVYIAGDTTSTNFPTMTPLQPANKGQQDAFVAEMSTTGSLVYSTYLGGSGNDRGAAVAVDSAGNAYVTGGTFSTNFPTAAAIQSASGGGQDAFIAKISPAGAALAYSTYFGGSGGALGSPETGTGIAVDSFGNAYVTGVTSSSNFPVTSSFQPLFGGGTENAFILKLNSAGSTALYSTYAGGSVADYANAIAIDLAGHAYVAGYTASSDFPLVSSVQAALAGAYNAFVLELNPSGSALNFSSYYGGGAMDAANGIALDPSGDIYIAGQTTSSNFPTLHALQTAMNGTIDAFVLKLTFPPPPDFSLAITPASNTVATGANAAYTVTAAPLNGFTGTINLSVSGLPAGVTAIFNPGSLAASGSSTLTLNASTTAAAGTYPITITGAGGSLTHNTTASLIITAPASPPSPVSVSPNSGSGSVQAFTFAFNNPGGAANIVSAQIDFASTLVTSNACYLYYSRASNAIYLATNAGSFSSQAALGSAATLQNSQCSINVAASTASISGNTLTLTLAASFTSAYAGAKNIYMEAYNGAADSGWAKYGAWTVTTAPPPPPDPAPDFSLAVTPASQTTAAGSAVSYTVTTTGSNGFASTVNLAVSGLPSGATATFNPASISGSGSTTLSVTTTSSVAAAAYTLTITATSGSLTHSATATLTVTAAPPPPASGPPAPVSVSPNSGSGSAGTFAFTFTNPGGAANIKSAQAEFSANLASAGACYVYYSHSSNIIYLASDAGSFSTQAALGSSTTLQNSQCSINPAASSASVSGNNLTLNLAVTFTSAFAGAKSIYMEVYNGSADSGWAKYGAWTVTASSPSNTPPPDFSLAATPATQIIAAGANTSFTVTTTAINAFTGAVNFTASGLPSGASANFAPSTVTGSGATTLAISTTSSAAAGNYTITVTATSGTLTHTATATLTITGSAPAGPPAPVSVTPSSGTGRSQTFVFTFTNPGGAANIASAQIDIGASLSAAGACYVYFSQKSNAVYLATDAGSFSSSAALGSSTTLQNSQCILNPAASSASISGNILTLNLALTFQSAYTGAKNIYMEVYNGTSDSGWAKYGAWTP